MKLTLTAPKLRLANPDDEIDMDRVMGSLRRSEARLKTVRLAAESR